LIIYREAVKKNFEKIAYYNELPVYKATYDLLLAIFQFTKNFSKELKANVQMKITFSKGQR